MLSVVRHLFPLVALALLALPGAALANSAQVVRDCAKDGDLDRSYSNTELRKALDDLPSDLDEYSDCRQVIRGAIGSAPRDDGGGGGGGASGGSSGGAASPAEQAARAELDAITGSASGAEPPRLDVGGRIVAPGSNGLFDLSSASNSLPVPLLIALIALGLLALAGGLVALRGRVPALARVPLLSKLSTARVSLLGFRR